MYHNRKFKPFPLNVAKQFSFIVKKISERNLAKSLPCIRSLPYARIQGSIFILTLLLQRHRRSRAVQSHQDGQPGKTQPFHRAKC